MPDKFFNNMQVRRDLNRNTVTVVGRNSAHRINTGKRDVAKLRWKKVKEGLGYATAVERDC